MKKNIFHFNLITTFILGFISINQRNISYAMPSKINVNRYNIYSQKPFSNIKPINSLKSNQRKSINTFTELDVLNTIYDCNKMMSEKSAYSEDFAVAFKDQYQNFLKCPFIVDKNNEIMYDIITGKPKYNIKSSNILKLNLVNYLISLNSKLCDSNKNIIKSNEIKNGKDYLQSWEENYYLILLDALNYDINIPKGLNNVVYEIINLDLDNGNINLNKFAKLINLTANNKLKDRIWKFVDSKKVANK